jgi:hypothetical protein
MGLMKTGMRVSGEEMSSGMICCYYYEEPVGWGLKRPRGERIPKERNYLSVVSVILRDGWDKWFPASGNWTQAAELGRRVGSRKGYPQKISRE